MARSPRIQVAGGTYHLTTRGARQLPIFVDDRDREVFLLLLREVIRRYRWRCAAYCLMANHYHVVVQIPEENLSSAMRALNYAYSLYFNRRHGFRGHAFDDRFHSVDIESTVQLVVVARYVVLNPVRAGLCRHPAEWPWSSYNGTAGRFEDPIIVGGRLLEEFGSDPSKAAAAYEAFIVDGIANSVTHV